VLRTDGVALHLTFVALDSTYAGELLVVGLGKIRDLNFQNQAIGMILPPQNVSLSNAVLMRKGGEDDEVKAGTLHA
jgi:hypothetical protein